MAVTAGPPERMAEMASTHGSVAERILLYIFLSPLLEFGKTVFREFFIRCTGHPFAAATELERAESDGWIGKTSGSSRSELTGVLFLKFFLEKNSFFC